MQNEQAVMPTKEKNRYVCVWEFDSDHALIQSLGWLSRKIVILDMYFWLVAVDFVFQ